MKAQGQATAQAEDLDMIPRQMRVAENTIHLAHAEGTLHLLPGTLLGMKPPGVHPAGIYLKATHVCLQCVVDFVQVKFAVTSSQLSLMRSEVALHFNCKEARFASAFAYPPA